MEGAGTEDDDKNPGKRYYPSPIEQQILVQHLSRYFSFPERSVERNKVAAEVSAALGKISTHWTHRAVRLWFNNNRHSYSETQTLPLPQHLPPPPPLDPAKPAVRFATENVWQKTTPVSHSTPEQSMATLSQIIQSANSMPNDNVAFNIMKYDEACHDFHTLRLLPNATSDQLIKFPSLQSESPSVELENLDLRNYGLRIPSRASTPGIWQRRAFEDQVISYFDVAYLNDDLAAFVHAQKMSPERAISFQRKQKTFTEQWETINLSIHQSMESLLYDKDNDCFWVIGGSVLLKQPLDGRKCSQVNLPLLNGAVPTNLTKFNTVTIAAFNNMPTLYCIDSRVRISSIKTPYQSGFTSLLSMNEGIVCGLSHSRVMRLIDAYGAEIRAFFGHTDSVIMLSRIDDSTFVSASDDQSGKIWDIRQRAPLYHVVVSNSSYTAVASCSNYVIMSTHGKGERGLIVVDLRNGAKPLVAISTDEYSTNNISYDIGTDLITMFCGATKDDTTDSRFFMNDSGGTNKYIFRQYRPFISV